MFHDVGQLAESVGEGSQMDEPRTSLSLSAQVRDLQNASAWRRFLEQYEPIIFGWAQRSGLQQTDAQDLTQDVLTKLCQSLPRFEYDSSKRFRDWLATIFKNALRDRWRRRAARPGDVGAGDSQAREALEQVADPVGLDADSFADELDGRLRPALLEAQEIARRVQERVEAHTWQAFWMTAVEQRPGPEVAKALGMNVAHVYVAKNRVIKMLRQERNRPKPSGGTPP